MHPHPLADARDARRRRSTHEHASARLRVRCPQHNGSEDARSNERGERASERGRHRGHVRPARHGVGLAAPMRPRALTRRSVASAASTRASRHARISTPQSALSARPACRRRPRRLVRPRRTPPSALRSARRRRREASTAARPRRRRCSRRRPPSSTRAQAGGAREVRVGHSRVSASAHAHAHAHQDTHGLPALACSLTLACLCSCARSHQRTNLAHTRTLANALTRSLVHAYAASPGWHCDARSHRLASTSAPRAYVHAHGLWHRSVHVWLVDAVRGTGATRVSAQARTTHIPADARTHTDPRTHTHVRLPDHARECTHALTHIRERAYARAPKSSCSSAQ